MRLIKCRVENFGILNNLTYDFTQGNNMILAENGWGKSTLAAFIKAMLYGLQNDRKRTGIANERARFAPWNKGTFGGELQFEANGKQYLVRRTFASKGNQDDFTLYDAQTNLESHDFTENLGVELFSLDADSFAKTVFLTQSDCEAVVTDAVSAKLGNISDNKNDMDRYNGADAVLKELTDRMSPTRKTGSIYADKSRLSELDARLRDGKNLDATMKQLTEKKQLLEQERTALQEAREGLEQQQSKLSVYADLKGQKQVYEGLGSNVVNRQKAYDQIRGYFPGECPERDALEEAKSLWNDAELCQRDLENAVLSEEEKSKLSALQEAFEQGVPSKDEVVQMLDNASRMEALEREAASLRMPEEDCERLAALKEKYQGKIPDEAVLITMKEQHRTLQDNGLKKQELQSDIRAKEQELQFLNQMRLANQKKAFPIWSFLIFALLCLVGCGVCFALQLHLAIALSFAGLSVFWVILFFFAKATKKEPVVEEPKEEKELAALQDALDKMDRVIADSRSVLQDFCESYHFTYDVNTFLEHLAAIQTDMARYQELSLRNNRLEESGVEDTLQKKKESIEQFSNRYGKALDRSNGDLLAITKLREDMDKFEDLQKKALLHAKLERQTREMLEKRDVFFDKYGFEKTADGAAVLDEIGEKLTVLAAAKEELAQAIEQKEAFEASHDCERILSLEVPEITCSVEEISEQLKENRERTKQVDSDIQGYDLQLSELQERLEEYQLVEEERAALQEKIQTDLTTRELLVKTRELLDQAKTSFTAKYTEPVMAGFRKYYKLVSGKESDMFTLDANMKLSFLSENQQREIISESAGNQDMIGICMRLALVDAMYTGEKPFLVLDDPFVNLDKAKTEGALRFLEEIAKEYQVIYFACHESRIIQ